MPPPFETGAVNDTEAFVYPAVAIKFVGEPGIVGLADDPEILVQEVPLKTCTSPNGPQLEHQITSAVAGDTIAIFWR